MMGGTKIVVFQLKEIIKNVAFVAIGLILIVFLILIFMPRGKTENPESAALYEPGTYYSEIILYNNPVKVAVTVDENEIVSINLENMDEIQTVFYPLFQPTMDTLAQEIITTQNLNVPITRDTAYTEEILIKAIRSALDKAEAYGQAS